jgi:hypothetical protein
MILPKSVRRRQMSQRARQKDEGPPLDRLPAIHGEGKA